MYFIYTSTGINKCGFCAKTEILESISACVILMYWKNVKYSLKVAQTNAEKTSKLKSD